MGEIESAKLNELLTETGKARERRDFAAVSILDAEFHQYIWDLSGNTMLKKALRLVCFPLWAFELTPAVLYREL